MLIYFLWVIAYGVLFFGGERLSSLIGIPRLMTAIFILIYAVALLFALNKQRKKRFLYGLRFKFKAIELLYFLPLLTLPIINLLTVSFNFEIFTLVTFLGVAIVEEVFFRNYLLLELNAKFSLIISALLSSLIFALFHAVNFINGFDLLFVAMQIISSFAVGVYFSAVTVKFKSVSPTILAHFIINLTGLGIIKLDKTLWAIIIGVASLAYLALGLIILIKRQNQLKKKYLEYR